MYVARYVSRRIRLAVQLGRTAFRYCFCSKGYMSIDVSVDLDLDWASDFCVDDHVVFDSR